MNSILRQINQNNDKIPKKELMQRYLKLIDEELNKLYSKTDCVDNYCQYFRKYKQNCRQFYHCVQNSCHFSTNKSSLIVRHIRRHLKEVLLSFQPIILYDFLCPQKPYMCSIDDCKYRFYQKCDLRCHLMRHFEDKPFRCHFPDCVKTYTTRKALSLHIKSHYTLRYDCKECHKMFATNWMLNKHSRERHSLSPQSVSWNPNEENIQMIAQQMVKPKVEPKIDSKLNSLNKLNVNSMTNQLIDSIDSINDQMKDELLSKQNIKSFSAEFGFEEVIKYVINTCGQPLNRETQIENNCETTPEIIEESIPPMETISSMDSNPNLQRNDLNPSANQMLANCVESVGSLIETYTLELIDSKKVLYKCFYCVFTSDTIEPIVRHVFDHIYEGVTQSLRNKLKA